MSNSKRGSALLIVLGFLSFMVVSAVAFSIYMRSERQPSSALRRVVTSRHLARAALARAMGEIDDAVRYEAFPGCLSETTKAPQRSGSANGQSGPTCQRAAWLGRVFMPLCPDDDIGNLNSDDRYIIPDERLGESVSTLTLEGLGYIPPPLVNDARYNSRRSWASVWKYFAFDAGRYAYTALNVSDYFDVNRLQAWTNRNSGADGRVTLSYLFGLKDGQMTQKASEMKSFDDFLRENRGGELGELPFVSMMDYTLALGQNSLASISPLFYEWLKTGNRSMFYNTVASDKQSALNNDQMLKAIRQPFVTDSWFPVTNSAANTVLDLSQSKYQPFTHDQLQRCERMTLAELAENGTETRDGFWGGDRLTRFNLVTMATLYDYLDKDNVPLSLALPCAEITPMIAAFSVANPPTFKLKKTKVTVREDDETKIYDYIYSISVDMSSLEIDVTPVFPFRRALERDLTDNSYKAQVLARVFFAPVADTWANRSSVDGFGQVGGRGSGKGTQSDWSSSASGRVDDRDSVAAMVEKSFTVKELETEDDIASKDIGFNVRGFATPAEANDLPLFKIRETDGELGAPEAVDNQFFFLNDDYGQAAVGSAVEFRPQIAVKIRIVDNDGKTVDCVPATGADDEWLNGRSGQASSVYAREAYGTRTPLLRLAMLPAQNLKLAADAFDTLGVEVEMPKDLVVSGWVDNKNEYVCCDPRFNWAPEDWILQDIKNGKGVKDWLALAKDNAFNGADCDADVFMNVSNAGQLQSIGELMFLPRVSDVTGGSGMTELGEMQLTDARLDGRLNAAVGDLANVDRMWRSYKPSALGGVDDDIYRLGFCNGQGGFKINPYTDDSTIFLGAIANTPVDWWAAATNVDTRTSSKEDKDLKFDESIKMSYGPESDTDKWTWDQVKTISETLRSVLRSALSDDSSNAGKTTDGWLSTYDSAWNGWMNSDTEDKLFGVNLSGSTLYDADRKFLYDYWRDCFGCRQQLFLIFVRAESTALGGNGDGGTPGQLGVRAVALVWRDPEAPSTVRDGVASQDADANKPENASTDTNPRPSHRMRVLFYHQFD